MVIRHPLTTKVIGCAIEVHRTLGPGLLENTYDNCLAKEFTRQQVPFTRQLVLPVVYKDSTVDFGYRLDFLIEDWLVVEVKAVDRLAPVHSAQILTYMKLMKARQGLLINFNVAILVRGLRSFLL
jgi:GxxExxY protein